MPALDVQNFLSEKPTTIPREVLEEKMENFWKFFYLELLEKRSIKKVTFADAIVDENTALLNILRFLLKSSIANIKSRNPSSNYDKSLDDLIITVTETHLKMIEMIYEEAVKPLRT